MPKKRDSGNPAFPVSGNTVFKFDKSVDSGPLPQDASPEMQKTLQDERIRRQVTSRLKRGIK